MKCLPTKTVILHVGDQQYPQNDLANVIKHFSKTVRTLSSAEIVGECIIMNDTDANHAAQCVADMKFDAIIVHYVSWHITPYVMRTLKDNRDKYILVYGSGGWTDSSGKLIAPAAAAGTTAITPVLKEFKFHYALVNGKPDEEIRIDDIDRFLRVAGAVKAVRHSRIGLYGYADMGLYSCSYNKTLVAEKLGVDIEDYMAHDLVAQMNAFTQEETDAAVDCILEQTTQENHIPSEAIRKVARLYLAMKGKHDSRGLDAISIKCVYGVTQMGFNPCLAQSLLADKDTSVICECDAYGMLTGILLSRVSGKASAFVEHYEVFDDSILVGVCGFIPKDFIEGDFKIRSANLGEFNTGISNVSKMKTGVCTFARLFETEGKFKLFLGKGEAKANPKWTEHGWCEPTPDFPSVLLCPDTKVKHYLDVVPGQHIVMIYGDWIEDIELFCKFMDIEIVR